MNELSNNVVFLVITMKLLYISAVKRLITSKINVLLHNTCVCTVYIYYVDINTHTRMYVFKKMMLCLYIQSFIYSINYMNINIYM